MRSRARRTAALGLLVLGTALLARGAWIPAKAVLAQVLLERSWQRTQGGEEAVRPWPWADTWPVARLRAPGRGWSVVVLAGATGRTLAFGPGHLAGSAWPGAPGNSVLAGHRDTHFAFLRHLAPGDELVLETPDGSSQRYTVRATDVVEETETGVLAPSLGRRLTLVTCFPFEAAAPGGPLRYVVTADVI